MIEPAQFNVCWQIFPLVEFRQSSITRQMFTKLFTQYSKASLMKKMITVNISVVSEKCVSCLNFP